MPSAELSPRHPVRSALLSDFERLVSSRVDRLEWQEAQSVGRLLGRLAWRLAGRDRRRTLDHLAIAFPELPGEARARIGRGSFSHFGAMLGECLWIGARDATEIARHVAVEGWEEVERVRREARPLIVVTGHCGNWELLAAFLNQRGLGMSVVARELQDPGFQASLLTFRERFGTRTIVRGTPGAARELLRTMRGNGALGILIDQDTKVEGVWVDFFGRTAWTPAGAAELALRFGAAVLPIFEQRLDDGSHLVRVEGELELPDDVTAATQTMTARIEAQIRRAPEQWVWLHRRWRRQPDTGAAPARQS